MKAKHNTSILKYGSQISPKSAKLLFFKKECSFSVLRISSCSPYSLPIFSKEPFVRDFLHIISGTSTALTVLTPER